MGRGGSAQVQRRSEFSATFKFFQSTVHRGTRLKWWVLEEDNTRCDSRDQSGYPLVQGGACNFTGNKFAAFSCV